jgi:type 1 glutamine amidotransferase
MLLMTFLRRAVFGCIFTITAPGAGAATPPAPLRVCLFSGANDSPLYATDTSLAALAKYLETEHGMTCTVLTWNAADKGFDGIDSLLSADAAVFFVRRKTPNEHNLAVLKKFFASGKGFVALRATSHAWENWPDFDTEVLGAKYGGAQGGNFGNTEKLHYRTHPILAHSTTFDTQRDIYRYGPVAADVTVIIEGENKNGRMPVAWTRVHAGGRLFHFALGYADEMKKSPYRRIVANALRWVTESEPARK